MPGQHPSLSRARERLAVFALTLAAFAVAVNVNLVGPMKRFVELDPVYGALEGDAARGLTNQLIWATSGAAFVASLLLGPLVDRVGRRLPMIVGGVMMVAAMVAHVVVQDHGQLVAARVVSGFGGGMVFMGASAAVADLVPYQRRGAAMGVFSLGLFLATPLGLPLAIMIAKGGTEAWRLAFGWLALPGVLAIAGFWLCPRDLGRSGQRVTQLQVLGERHVVASLLSVMLYTGAFFTVVQFVPSWLDESSMLAKEKQSLLWVVLGLSSAAGTLVLPRIADRVGKRNVVLLTSGGVAVCLVLLARVEDLTGLWVIGLTLAMLASARTPALQALMSEIVEPRMRGTRMGLRAAAVNLGAFAFAALGGAVYTEHGFESLAYGAAGAVVAAYLLVRLFVRVSL